MRCGDREFDRGGVCPRARGRSRVRVWRHHRPQPPIDLATAEAIASTRIDAVIAPAVDEAAKAVLAKKANMRVVVADFSKAARGVDAIRSILGAMLLQERDVVVEARQPWNADALPPGFEIPTERQPTAEEWVALRFAWRICAHVKSNTIIFTDAQRTLAIGAGQMSRVDAANVAVMKARDAKVSLAGSVCALRRVLPVPRRPRRRRQRRRESRHPARRLGEGRRGHRRRRRTRHRHGLHRLPSFQARGSS